MTLYDLPYFFPPAFLCGRSHHSFKHSLHVIAPKLFFVFHLRLGDFHITISLLPISFLHHIKNKHSMCPCMEMEGKKSQQKSGSKSERNEIKVVFTLPPKSLKQLTFVFILPQAQSSFCWSWFT